ncbi:HK97 gp10 family phage protein [Paenibacillus sp. NPDC093718]|uniref:HK97 gp10 family phage protein n=1 Tax=Paenibacillus sp. NPDC093718 TaxID=3390601 RepID=UPI003D04169E
MGMEIEGLDKFDRYLLKKAQDVPKESYKIMRKLGTVARKKALTRGKAEVKKIEGDYQRGWKRGKAYRASDGSYRVKVYNSSMQAHWIERGHRIVGKKPEKKEHGFAKGKFVLDKSMREFQENEMVDMIGDWLDEMLDKGL